MPKFCKASPPAAMCWSRSPHDHLSGRQPGGENPTRIVLDVHGVGYEVFIPLSSFDRLPDENAPCRV